MDSEERIEWERNVLRAVIEADCTPEQINRITAAMLNERAERRAAPETPPFAAETVSTAHAMGWTPMPERTAHTSNIPAAPAPERDAVTEALEAYWQVKVRPEDNALRKGMTAALRAYSARLKDAVIASAIRHAKSTLQPSSKYLCERFDEADRDLLGGS
jgi:hypothetical protein